MGRAHFKLTNYGIYKKNKTKMLLKNARTNGIGVLNGV